ncbi:hypothetical protein Vafri_18080 [Volvox africanus]|uniref:Uncharacterized protein n=1 Tax=Volvox africanus TaxID=51714 RepID=A0A8J4BKK0_9CHLO|nr:hypothetical protein Vafri_18080 [Volvox africanus]
MFPTSHHITSHHITSHHITSHHITSHHITSHHHRSPGAVFHWGRGVLQLKSPPPLPTTDVSAPPEATPSQPPPPGDGWQLVGFTQQHPATGQPLLLHRTMNKWPALKRSVSPPHPEQHPAVQTPRGPEGQVPQQSLRHHQRGSESESEQPGRSWTEGRLQAAEQVWPIQVLTGPLPTGWCEYYLAHDSWGPTKGVLWEHVVPEAALQLVLHPAYGAAEAGCSAGRTAGYLAQEAAGTSFPTNVTQLSQLCDSPQRYTELLQGAFVGLPTARSAAAEALHAACGPLLRATIERAAGRIHIHVHTASAATVPAAASRRPSDSAGGYGGSTIAGSALKAAAAAATSAGKTPSGNAGISIGGMRRRKDGQSSARRVKPVQHRKRSLTPSIYNQPTPTAATAALAAAKEIMSPPWSVQNWCLAMALAETLLPSSGPPPPPQRRQDQQLPSWPSLHAAVLRTCLTEPYLERPYTAKSPPQPPQPPQPSQPPQPPELHLEGQLQSWAEDSALAEVSLDSGDLLLRKGQRHDFKGAEGKGVAPESLATGFLPTPPSVPGWPLPPPPLAGLAVCVEAPRWVTGGDLRTGRDPIQSRSLAGSGSAQPASTPSLNARDMEDDRCDGAPRENSGSSSSSSSRGSKTGKAGSGKMGNGGEMEPRSWWRLAAGKDEQLPKWTWPRQAVGVKCGADGCGRPGEEDSPGSGDVRSTNREMCDPWVLSAAALDDPMLGSITAAYREYEWVLAAADTGNWPQLLDG